MSVGVLLVTHNRIGEELLATVNGIMGPAPLPCAALSVSTTPDLPELVEQGRKQITALDDGDGVLVLTDAFGSTPSNVAVRLGSYAGTGVVSGVNLPMLLRVMNYPDLPLDALHERAYTGGRDGVIRVEPPSGERPEDQRTPCDRRQR